MHVGVTIPIAEFGANLAGLRDFVQAAEDLGYDHIRLLDHVLGADPNRGRGPCGTQAISRPRHRT
jgi:hypothetical protein